MDVENFEDKVVAAAKHIFSSEKILAIQRLCCINQLRDEFSLTLSKLTFSKQPRFWGFQAR